MELKNHDLPADLSSGLVRYTLEAVKTPDGKPAEGLWAAWITLDNPSQYNSYTTEMVKDVILAFRRASNARDVVSVVFTGAGDRAFCTGGNTREYAQYYSGRPEEYAQYMRLFNDMVTSILTCDNPVICRVNGLRVGGGQEIGMACDYSIASDMATFGQAGPKHGSAPDGGATDFLPLFVGVEAAMASCTLCEPWTAYQAARLGLITQAVPVLRVGGELVPNPLVVTDRWVEGGRVVFGEPKRGEELARGKAALEAGKIDLAPLDAAVERMVSSLLMTFPGCLQKTIESVRKHKLVHWDRNRETNRAWLALNMMTEAHAGFRAFNEGKRGDREIDFVALRRRMAEGASWGPALIEEIMPRSAKAGGGS
ncbi:MAG: 6-oxocyclohex-1-ene-1-carbonyl-CoA hydratase [Deltaproteobacteria bacterium]|nr:6-oxocyclohex-1-ene-1-carbonyl-CoA hydratase [Deltaproteobacteria bacterium]